MINAFIILISVIAVVYLLGGFIKIFFIRLMRSKEYVNPKIAFILLLIAFLGFGSCLISFYQDC